MGEQPLFSCKAHVFQLEPEMKKSWLSLSSTAVNVQIFHDPIKNIYRIVSIEGTKALINSIVTPKMTFTKTSQKFGQWIDFKLNLVYGLGFSNDIELNKFVEKFKEIKELTRNSVIKTHERSNSCEISSAHRNNNDLYHETNDNQTKYENERLKNVLAQTTANARKWEEEIQSLKLANTRLTNSLQESHSNVEDWKKQLQYYKDECNRLRNINNTNGHGHILNNSINYLNKNDDYDEVSSSTSGNTNSLHKNNNSKKLKQELTRLSDNFDKKLKELHEIREQMRKIINELS